MSRVLILASLGVALALTPAGAGQVNPKLIRVFVHTADSGHEDELAARRESLKDLTAWLENKKKDLQIVKDEDSADVVVEVMGRALTVPKVVVGSVPSRPGQTPLPQPPPARVVQLSVELRHRARTTEFKNTNSPLESARGWRTAAENVAAQLHKWMTDRRTAILEAR
jgi:hypothetical protein